jgi:hypothetical protein
LHFAGLFFAHCFDSLEIEVSKTELLTSGVEYVKIKLEKKTGKTIFAIINLRKFQP